jgi:hypothetical protein
MRLSRPSRFASGLVACAWLSTACGAGTPGPSSGTPAAGPPLSNAAPAASLSGTWIGSRPDDGMLMSFAGCGACGDAPSLSAGDLVLNVSDSNHALSGIATWTVREYPPSGWAVGEVISASVTGAVRAGGRVSMRWDATVGDGPTSALFILEGSVRADTMSGTVVLTGGDVPGGSASGTWSARLQ